MLVIWVWRKPMFYQLFLFGSAGQVYAGENFSAESDSAALDIGSATFLSSSEEYEHYEVWREDTLITTQAKTFDDEMASGSFSKDVLALEERLREY
jgi:hypothetical protein